MYKWALHVNLWTSIVRHARAGLWDGLHDFQGCEILEPLMDMMEDDERDEFGNACAEEADALGLASLVERAVVLAAGLASDGMAAGQCAVASPETGANNDAESMCDESSHGADSSAAKPARTENTQGDTECAGSESAATAYPCAGEGDLDATVWLCKTCISHLCRADKHIALPPFALANGFWGGREHPLYQGVGLGTRMLLSRGRPCWRKLILGKGEEEEQQKGITGNHILLAQAQPEVDDVLPPTTESIQNSFVALFARSIDQVKKAQTLTVERQRYVQCLQLRKQVCEAFADTPIAEDRVLNLPERGVPEQILACAQQLKEADQINPANVGPATRSHGFDAGTGDAEDEDNAEYEEQDVDEPGEEDKVKRMYETNMAETVIAVDHSKEPGLLETFAAFQTKLGALQDVASRMMSRGSSAAKPACVPPSEAADDGSLCDATARAAAKEECRHLVLEAQNLAKQMTRIDLKKMAEGFDAQVKALVSTTGKALSMFDPQSWTMCFVDFLYGDCTPNMRNRPVYVPMEEIFPYLQDREELAYALASDTQPYIPRTRSRFDTPEYAAVFGDVLRRLLILRGVAVTFKRQGYEQDLKMIAKAKADHCVEALCSLGQGQQSLDRMAYADQVPKELRAALKQVMISTAAVPFTDGYRRKLRHEGHNLNVVHGTLKIFMTCNFSDTYSPLLFTLLLGDSAEKPVAPAIRCSLADQQPQMPTLQQMHGLVAASPRSQAKFFLLMDELVDRYFLGIARCSTGKLYSARSIHDSHEEDDFASAGEPGFAGMAKDALEPLEAQGRGFAHGHRKVYGVPEQMTADVLRQFHDSNELQQFLAASREALIQCAATIQYEAATLPAQQLGQPVPPERFTRRQQQLSRLDGGLEIDGTRRDNIDVTEEEHLGHVARELKTAAAEHRAPRNSYRDVELTGCHNSLLPHYRQPHHAFTRYELLDEMGMHPDAAEAARHTDPAVLQNPLGAVLQNPPLGPGVLIPWVTGDDGSVVAGIAATGTHADVQDVQADAERWSQCFARDARALHTHNHDHDCTHTCTKYAKAQAQKEAEKKTTSLQQAIICRFFFFITLVFEVLEGSKTVLKRIRRRGKALVKKAFVAATNLHNEFGRVQVVMLIPFRSPSTDIGQAGGRSNIDLQFMPRATPPPDEADAAGDVPQIPYAQAAAFYGVRLKLPSDAALRRAAHSMVAMFQAAHNCDFYMTKYQSKPLEQLQNLMAQLAFGLRCLESEESRENVAATDQIQTDQQRARRVTIRIAMAANRSTWVSCCEMAIFIRTGAHARKTYMPRDVFLSRIAFSMHRCQGLLAHSHQFLTEAADESSFNTLPLSAIAFASDTAAKPVHGIQSDPLSVEEAMPQTLPGGSVAEPGHGIQADPVRAEEATAELQQALEQDADMACSDASQSDQEDSTGMEMLHMKQLRATTSVHDDWLHRGPFLHDAPFHVYAQYVDRVRRPQTDSMTGQYFLFESHYTLAHSYCQQIRTPARLPVMEALKCPSPAKGNGEENAMYKSILGVLLSCKSKDCCSDPMLFKPALFCGGPRSSAEAHEACESGDSDAKPVVWSFKRQWKARRAEIELLADRGQQKADNAKRIPCILDTTLVRGWCSADAPLTKWHRYVHFTLAQLWKQRFGMIRPDCADLLLAMLAVPTGTHPHQLTLSEFCAIRLRTAVQNLDFMATARSIKLTAQDKDAAAVEVEAESGLPRKPGEEMNSEFVGGEGEDFADYDEEQLTQNTPCPEARLELSTVQAMLAREKETEAASKRGRHRDADVQMKEFADKFGAHLRTPVPSPVGAGPQPTPFVLASRAVSALTHQKAVMKSMRKDPQDLQDELALGADVADEAAQAALQNLLHESTAEWAWIDVPDLMQGPAHVAELIMAKNAALEKPFILNDEQKNLYALWVSRLQHGFLLRSDKTHHWLDAATVLLDIIVDGGGGCGKTMLINKFFVPLCRAFYGARGVVLNAPSNKAARGIGGKTMHAAQGLTPDSSLRTAALALKPETRRKLECIYLPAGVQIIDEYSMLLAVLNHAGALRSTYAREARYKLKREDYAMKHERFGRMAVLLYAGDHLQLPPVPKSASLLAPLQGTSQEHKVGAAIFRNCEFVFRLTEMQRFDDPQLVRILHTMRTPGGAALPQEDWAALLDTQMASAEKPATLQELNNCEGWYHTCYVWSIVSIASFMEARMSATRSGKTLFYIQAVDVMQTGLDFGTSQKEKKALHENFLRVPNMSTTKRLPGYCLVHYDMRMRLTTTLEMPYAVQDILCTVKGIEFDPCDSAAKACARMAQPPGEVLLDSLPLAIYVKLDDCDHTFLPCPPCAAHAAIGRNTSCEDCAAIQKEYIGLIAVTPLPRVWKYEASELQGKHIKVSRRQFPLAPAMVLPLYSMQGMTADPGLVAHWIIPSRLSPDIKWLICYVILSRPRSLKRLRSVGLTQQIRDIIETGPPENLVHTFQLLFAEKMEHTQRAAKAARHKLGWQ